MKPEDAKTIKCRDCGAVVGLYRDRNHWICPKCLAGERDRYAMKHAAMVRRNASDED